jgi:hypothetical protein
MPEHVLHVVHGPTGLEQTPASFMPQVVEVQNLALAIYGVYGGHANDFLGASRTLSPWLDGIWSTAPRTDRWKWLHQDFAVREWFIEYGYRLFFDRLFDYEYVLTRPIDELLPQVSGRVVAFSGLKKLVDHHGIVVATASATHAARDGVRIEHPLIVLTRIRAALVRVMEQSGVRTSPLQRHAERGQREVPVIHGADGPPDDEPREQIKHNRDVQLAPLADHELRRVTTRRRLGASAAKSRSSTLAATG